MEMNLKSAAEDQIIHRDEIVLEFNDDNNEK